MKCSSEEAQCTGIRRKCIPVFLVSETRKIKENVWNSMPEATQLTDRACCEKKHDRKRYSKAASLYLQF
ncbi:hypothetical protein GUJ93_ZPchr0010g8659 [Zizania palustris]|uniref:Uncharacterized protein n=1 Tax=Zizania palustris TaxID=103762 RepID=A0A8J6BCF5_ZIZPA|nr:hypothetical protein GUJ93_ZPchr0010g8659 [Zizania palustris]